MSVYERAYELKDELVRHRRTIHQFAEVGFEVNKTADYVKEQLRNMGCQPQEITKNGIVATVGEGAKTFLLRADMDALPIAEESGLEFASVNGNCHACGHDTHTSMLLTAARILKEQESSLKGKVKLMFQPAEELLTGAEKMVEAGVLKNPEVDCGLMIHISSTSKPGIGIASGPKAASSNNFKITITGKGAHGAMPETGIDPVMIGAHIIIDAQQILSREIAFTKGAVLTMGHFEGGSAANIIPSQAIIQGTTRTFTNETQAYIKKRLPEIVQSIAATYHGEAKLEFTCDVPVMVNDPVFTADVYKYIGELAENNFAVYEVEPSTGSEDFAFVGVNVPACMLSLGAPDPAQEKLYPLHNPKVTFDEEQLPMGAAVLAGCAMRWLEEHSK